MKFLRESIFSEELRFKLPDKVVISLPSMLILSTESLEKLIEPASMLFISSMMSLHFCLTGLCSTRKELGVFRGLPWSSLRKSRLRAVAVNPVPVNFSTIFYILISGIGSVASERGETPLCGSLAIMPVRLLIL